jgi:hypothetical protein
LDADNLTLRERQLRVVAEHQDARVGRPQCTCRGVPHGRLQPRQQVERLAGAMSAAACLGMVGEIPLNRLQVNILGRHVRVESQFPARRPVGVQVRVDLLNR